MDTVNEYIKNNTKFAIYKINYSNGKSGYDKNYIIKVFLSIWFDGYETVCIERKLCGPEGLIGYDYYNDYYILSNGKKIIFNDDSSQDYICWIVSDELEQTDFNYFIMELNIFEVEYSKFRSKLSVLIDSGYDARTIRYFFDEFTKEPEIDIL